MSNTQTLASVSDAVMQVRPQQLIAIVSNALLTHTPVFVVGAPGVGKSDCISEAAARVGADFLLSHPASEDSTALPGMPFPYTDTDGTRGANFVPYGTMRKAINAQQLTCWLADDMGNAAGAVQATYQQAVLSHRIGEQVLPEHVVFIIATNRRADRSGVQQLSRALQGRCIVVELVAHPDDFCTWAVAHDISPVVVAHIRLNPAHIVDAEISQVDIGNRPSPRNWARASKVLSYDFSMLDAPDAQHARLASLVGCVGREHAIALLQTERMIDELPNLDAIFADPNSATIPQRPDTLYMLCTALASRCTVKRFAAIGTFALRMSDEAQRGEFATLLVRDCIARVPGVVNTPEFGKLATGAFGDALRIS